MSRPPVGARAIAAVLSLASIWACNSILDIKEGHVAGGVGCVLNSDCSGAGEVCLFRVCSQPCRKDLDCASGARCLTTDKGTACAAATSSACTSDDECEGATCAQGVCRASCRSDGDCLTGQACSGDLCFGTDPNHDSTAVSGSGGSGGSGSVNAMAGVGAEAGAPVVVLPQRECDTSATRCNAMGERETCSADGTWGSAVKCPFVCVEADRDCGGECVPDRKDCVEGLTPRVCNQQGKWEKQPDCAAVCVDGACQASCEKGSRQCSGKDVLLCSDLGKFEKSMTCPFLCDPDSKSCTGECTPTSQQCKGLQLQSCGADAMWQKLADCPSLCTEKVGMAGQFECTGVCLPTSNHCDDAATLQTCNANGQYDTTNCAGQNKTCFGAANAAACGGSCAPGQKKCVNNKVQACSAMGGFADSLGCVNTTCVAVGTNASCVGSCSPGQQQCAGNRVQTCNGAGDYADTTDCTPLPKTCVKSGTTASCVGSCSPGQTTCINNNAQQCGADGSYGLLDDCTPPDEICNAGACVPNTPYPVGNSTTTGYSNFDPPNDFWYVVKVVPPNTANVIGLRLIGRSATGLARLALWEDSAGAPGAFVAQTNNVNMAAGVVSAAPVPLATKLTAGKAYWLGAKFSGGAQIYQKAVPGQTVYTFGQTFGLNPSTTMSPFPVGAADSLANFAFNFYLLVQDESL